MAAYNGRRAPNFAQYLDDLNAIPSPYDQALQQQQQQSNFNVDEELSLFTNAEFFDFDNFGDLSLPSFDSVDEKATHSEIADQTTQNGDLKFLDFLNGESRSIFQIHWSSQSGWTKVRVERVTLNHTIPSVLVRDHFASGSFLVWLSTA